MYMRIQMTEKQIYFWSNFYRTFKVCLNYDTMSYEFISWIHSCFPTSHACFNLSCGIVIGLQYGTGVGLLLQLRSKNLSLIGNVLVWKKWLSVRKPLTLKRIISSFCFLLGSNSQDFISHNKRTRYFWGRTRQGMTLRSFLGVWFPSRYAQCTNACQWNISVIISLTGTNSEYLHFCYIMLHRKDTKAMIFLVFQYGRNEYM